MDVPPGALVVLIGAAGSGKSTFASRHFPREAIVSSDQIRASIRRGSADINRQNDVFELMHALVEKRLAAGLLTVVDATNTDWMRRSELIRTARGYDRAAVAIVFNLPLEICLAQNAKRSDAVAVTASAIRRQVAEVERDLDRLDLEGFSSVYVLRSPEDVAHAALTVEEQGQGQ